MKIWNTDIYQGANKATLASMKKFELQKAQAEKLAEAHKLKTRYEFYKAEYNSPQRESFENVAQVRELA